MPSASHRRSSSTSVPVAITPRRAARARPEAGSAVASRARNASWRRRATASGSALTATSLLDQVCSELRAESWSSTRRPASSTAAAAAGERWAWCTPILRAFHTEARNWGSDMPASRSGSASTETGSSTIDAQVSPRGSRMTGAWPRSTGRLVGLDRERLLRPAGAVPAGEVDRVVASYVLPGRGCTTHDTGVPVEPDLVHAGRTQPGAGPRRQVTRAGVLPGREQVAHRRVAVGVLVEVPPDTTQEHVVADQ